MVEVAVGVMPEKIRQGMRERDRGRETETDSAGSTQICCHYSFSFFSHTLVSHTGFDHVRLFSRNNRTITFSSPRKTLLHEYIHFFYNIYSYQNFQVLKVEEKKIGDLNPGILPFPLQQPIRGQSPWKHVRDARDISERKRVRAVKSQKPSGLVQE